MSDYTPALHEARARFISGTIETIRRRTGCLPSEAEDIATEEFDRWLEQYTAETRAEWEAERSGLTPEQINALPVGAVVMTETDPATFGVYEQRVWQKFGGVPEWQFGFPRHEWQSTDGGFEQVGQSDRHRGQFGFNRRVTLLWMPVNENGETP